MLYAILAYHVEEEVTSWTPQEDAALMADLKKVRDRLAQSTHYFMLHGVPDPATASHQAIVALGNSVRQQALIMGFSDTFAVIGFVLAFAAVAILFTRKVQAGGAAAAH